MNCTSIAVLVGIAALSAALSSDIPVTAWVRGVAVQAGAIVDGAPVQAATVRWRQDGAAVDPVR